MKLVVRTRGGVLGMDRQVVVQDRVGTVSEQGRSRTLHLDADQAARLEAAAGRVASGVVIDTGPAEDAVDGGVSEIEIEHESGRTSLRLPAGSTAPDDVWALLDVVDEVCAGA